MSRWLTREGKAMVERIASDVGLTAYVVRQMLEYINTSRISQVLIARANRGLSVPDDRIEYIPFYSPTTPEEVIEHIGAGEPTCTGIQEVLNKEASVWVIVGP